jgi:hypothetical protein
VPAGIHQEGDRAVPDRAAAARVAAVGRTLEPAAAPVLEWAGPAVAAVGMSLAAARARVAAPALVAAGRSLAAAAGQAVVVALAVVAADRSPAAVAMAALAAVVAAARVAVAERRLGEEAAAVQARGSRDASQGDRAPRQAAGTAAESPSSGLPVGIHDRGQYVVLPAAVYKDVVARIALDREARPPENSRAADVVRHVVGRHPVKAKPFECVADCRTDRLDHVPVALGPGRERIPDQAVLARSPLDLGKRDVADHAGRVLFEEDEGSRSQPGFELRPALGNLVAPVLGLE